VISPNTGSAQPAGCIGRVALGLLLNRAPNSGCCGIRRKLAEGLVQWGPLHEPDHFIDVRELLAKSGSPSRRRLMMYGD
jgi:hypothetical protein